MKNDKNKKNDCFQGKIFEQDIVDFLKKLIKAELEKTVDISKTQKKADELIRKNQKAVQRLQKEIADEKKKKLAEYMRLTKDEISEEEFVKNRNDIDDRMNSLNKKIQALTYQKISEEDISVLNLFGKYVNVTDLNDAVIRDLVKAVYVYNDKRIEVVWNFRDNFIP